MKARLLYIDNLRWVMILLVVSMHAAVTYSHLGSWYYMEDRPVSMAETAIFATYQASLQSFFMGFLFFIAGYVADGKYWGRVALIGGLLCWVALLVLGGATKGALPDYKGGMHWQSLGMSFWEAMTGTAISLYLLVLFRERFNRQGSAARFFSANAFAVYVFHAPILIALSRCISPVQAPLLLKFLFLTLISLAVSYTLCSLLFRKLPLLRRIL